MSVILNVNFIIGIITSISILFCSITTLISYFRLRFKTILLYFLGIFFLIFATGSMTIGTLELPVMVVKSIQSYTFSVTWLGIYFLYLAIKFSKGDLYKMSTHIVSGFIGSIITLYTSGMYYDIVWDPIMHIWVMKFHPILLLLIVLLMISIIYELISFTNRLFLTSRDTFVKNNLKLFFIGWIVLASSSIALGISLFFEFIPLYTFLIVLTAGLILISISIIRFPSSLIASPIKVYAIGYIQASSGLLLHSYDFTKTSKINRPQLFSGLMVAANTALQESIMGCRYIKTMDAGPRKILIARGFYIQAVMVTEQYTEQFEAILNRLLIQFELQFFKNLSHFDGEVTIFQKFNNVIKKYMAFAL